MTKGKSRETYYTMIFQYKKRRKDMISKYGRFADQPKQLTKKIQMWKHQIRMIDKRNIQIIAIANAVALYTGYNVKGSGGIRGGSNKLLMLARGLFYKYCLENGISGHYLREYTGDIDVSTPSDVRRRFTQSFESSPENKQHWLNFKERVEEKEEEKKEE